MYFVLSFVNNFNHQRPINEFQQKLVLSDQYEY